jgi:predicted phosphodiesterase
MKILVLSDTHNKHQQIPSECIENADNSIDMIMHAGDVSSRGTMAEVEAFLEWYDGLPYAHKILIAGNHDFYLEEAKKEEIDTLLAKYPSITYLNDSGVEIDGLKIWGSPVQPWFYNWAFNRKGADICRHWDLIPLDTDILMCHGGPKNAGSLNITAREREDVGCPYLCEKISELKQLKLFVQGHIHEGRGNYSSADGKLFINASVLNLSYQMANKPYVVDTENWEIIDG